jgi:hypothetical protein
MPGIWPVCSSLGAGLGDGSLLAACARISRVRFVRLSGRSASEIEPTAASGADGLAGLSAVSGGEVGAHPASEPNATSNIKRRFIAEHRDR